MSPRDGVHGDRERAETLALANQLGSRMLPLAVLTAIIVSLSAPLAIFSLRLQELRLQAENTARDGAEWTRREMQQRSELWRYDTAKLVDHLRAYEVSEDLLGIVIVGPDRQPIDLGGEGPRLLNERSIIWAHAEVAVDDEPTSAVWVAMSTAVVRRDALLLLALFGILGSALGGMMYAVPLRTITGAERRLLALVRELEGSRQALGVLNQTLEDKVRERSSQLQRTYAELKTKERNLRELTSRVLTLQENERRAIARELHDSAGQALTAIRINLQLMHDTTADNPTDHERVGKTIQMTDLAVEEIRRAVLNLGPAILDDMGLVKALRRNCDDFAERTQIEVEHEIACDGPLTTGHESALYRIVQESLTNIARHAQARSVVVKLRRDATAVHLEVRDDGRGFDPSLATGHGLVGVRERVELLAGSLELATAPGAGTRLRVRLPLPPDVRDDDGESRE